MSARAEDAARVLPREQPATADAAVPAPANNGSADAEGVEIPAPEPSGNKNLLAASAYTMDAPASTRAATVENTGQQPHRHHMALRSQVSVGGGRSSDNRSWSGCESMLRDTMDSTNEAQDKLPRQPSILKRSRSEGESPSPRTPDMVAEAADEEWAWF